MFGVFGFRLARREERAGLYFAGNVTFKDYGFCGLLNDQRFPLIRGRSVALRARRVCAGR